MEEAELNLFREAAELLKAKDNGRKLTEEEAQLVATAIIPLNINGLFGDVTIGEGLEELAKIVEEAMHIIKGTEHTEEFTKPQVDKEAQEKIAQILWFVDQSCQLEHPTQRHFDSAEEVLKVIEILDYCKLPKLPDNIEITEFAEILYNLKDIKTIKANIESFLLANHYVKLPERKAKKPVARG